MFFFFFYFFYFILFYFIFYFLFFIFLFFIYLFILFYFLFVNLLLPLRLSLSVSLSTYLSLSQSWCLSLSRCIKKEKEKNYLFIYLSIFFLLLYGGTSGLHAHTYGHAWLGAVCCCWHVAVGCCTLLWYPVCLLVLANHQRHVAGCLANKLHCLLYSFFFFFFLFFTNWWSQRPIWWNVLDKSLVTGVLELSPWSFPCSCCNITLLALELIFADVGHPCWISS